MLRNKFVLGAGSLVAVTIIAGAFLTSVSVSADDNVVDNVNIEVPVSCSLEGTGMTSHNANIVNGTYQPDIGSTTLKAFCNDSNGFAIYAIGFSNEEYGNTNLIGASSSINIVTGTATSAGNPDTSNWAMKLSTDGTATYPITLDNSFNAYHIVPSTYTKVAHRDSATDIGTNATGASLTSTYAAYISKTQNADSYNGKVKYTIVHPASETPAQPVVCQAGKICYNANSSSVIGQMGKQTPTSSQLTNGIPLWAPNFKRDGYGFAGWNDKFDYSGNYYGPNETITAPADISTNGLSLYAVWIKSAGSLQNWSGCSGLAGSATTALTDSRDGNTYAVAKLADGKCWMIENLRLADKDSSNNDVILSSTNTHNPSLPLTNIYDSNTTSNHLSSTSSVAYDATTAPEGWCRTFSADCIDQSRLRTDNTVLYTNNTVSGYSATDNVYSYGNYYNWYSATGGQGKYGTSYGEGFNALGDICPAGWHLPKGGNKSQEATNEFWQLVVVGLNNGVNPTNYASMPEPYYSGSVEAGPVLNTLRAYPNNFVNSGFINNMSISSRNERGYYWSATGVNNSYAYSMFLISDNSTTSVHPGNYYNGKYFGWAIRCIAGV